MTKQAYLHSILVLAFSLTACTGSVFDSLAGSSSGSSNSETPDWIAAERERLSATTEPGSMVMRRLSSTQYQNALKSILGVPEGTVSTPVVDPTGNETFRLETQRIAIVNLTGNDLRAYGNAAEQAAAWAFESNRRQQTVGCNATQDSCAQDFIDSMLRRIFRHAPSTEERNRYQELYAYAKAELDDGWDALEMTTAGMLQSPQFIYRHEATGSPDGSGSIKRDGYSMASLISFTLTNSPPDDALLTAAEDGTLDTIPGVEEHVRRLARTDLGKITMTSFLTDWLGVKNLEQVTKDTTVFPEYSAELAADMKREIERMFDSVLSNNLKVSELLTFQDSQVNGRLAEHYGIENKNGDDWSMESYPASHGRVGILGMAGILTRLARAADTNIIQRGHYIVERFNCQKVPPPPPNLADLIAEVSQTPAQPGDTEADRVDVLTERNDCKGCHGIMNPPGIVLQSFDAVGQYRATERVSRFEGDTEGEEVPVRTWTTINDERFEDLPEFVTSITPSDLAECFSELLVSQTLGRRPTPGETPATELMGATLDVSMEEMLVALMTSKIIRYTGEV